MRLLSWKDEQMVPDFRGERLFSGGAQPEDLARQSPPSSADIAARLENTHPSVAVRARLHSMFHQCFAQRRAELALRESAAHFRILAEQGSDSIFLHDADGRVVDVNQRACDALGYSRQELLALKLPDIDTDSAQHGVAALFSALSKDEPLVLESRFRRRDGTLFPVEMRIGAMRMHGRRHLLFLVRDISANRRIQQCLHHLADHDSLTGLPNRGAFLRSLQNALQDGGRLALLLVDLDRFRHLNEALGEIAGDRLLQEAARRLQAALPPGAMLARTGGDEFAALLRDGHCMQQLAAARGMLAALEEDFMLDRQPLHLSASIGVSFYPEDGDDCRQLLRHAEAALQRAKTAGRDKLQRHDPGADAACCSRPALEAGLHHAARRGELELHYQAKVDARSNRISGCEALLRWRHPEQGLLLPERFIPLAEETGLIVPLTRWVLHEACRQVQVWQALGLAPGPVAVNLSAGPFIDAGLVQDVRQALLETGMDPALLELEITESMMLHGAEHARAVLAGLKALGISIAIDDFGIGYSSLSQLKSLPIDIIKIDRSFITDVPGDQADEAITTAIVAMGKSLRVAVVAEGVEAAEQLDFLRGLGCDQIQGYYFSRPLPAAQFERLLLAQRLQEDGAA
jgi:diguanylate cyclase (GGDEF)-like protein/PAS domain S-box-containing protein